jgi:uncharacterized protein (TIRG00374 family)
MNEAHSSDQSSHTKPRWYLPLAIGLSIIFLYLAVRGVSWNEFINAIRYCQVVYLVPAIAISLINFMVRSQRWGILLREKQKVAASTLFWATGTGYLGNNFLPFRAGEVIRSVVLGQKTGISKVYVFATALTERVIDALFLILLGLLLVPAIGNVPSWLPPAMRVLGILGLAALLILLIAPRLEHGITTIIFHLPIPGKWHDRLGNFVKQFLQGAASFQKPKRSALFLLLTCLIWLLDGTTTMISAKAFSIDISLSQALLLLVGLGLSSAIPSAPGSLGIYQYTAVTILAIYGYPKSQALAFILVAQAIGMLLTLIWGLAGLGILGISRSDLQAKINIPIDAEAVSPYE